MNQLTNIVDVLVKRRNVQNDLRNFRGTTAVRPSQVRGLGHTLHRSLPWDRWQAHGTVGEVQLRQFKGPPHSPVIFSVPSIHCPPAPWVLPVYPLEHQGTNRLTHPSASSLFTWFCPSQGIHREVMSY